VALVTLFTDASYNHRLRRGTWAAWAKCNGVTMRRSGILRDEMFGSTHAELAAVANGLVAVKQTFGPDNGSKIIIQSDCLNGLTSIRNGTKKTDPASNIASFVNDYAKTQGWELDLRHVKGHRAATTPRNAVNTACDVECRRQMGLLLEQLGEATKTKPPRKHKAADNVVVLHPRKGLEQINAEITAREATNG
jgi:ribonuclease HI